MQVNLDDLKRRYETMSDEELVALIHQGELSEEAAAVLEGVFAKRGIDPTAGLLELEKEPIDRIPSLPRAWPGFALAALCFSLEIVSAFQEIGASGCWLFLIALTGHCYWFWCVHRLHRVLAVITKDRYPISPGNATFRHLIPVFNLYWIFKWPSVLAKFLEERGARKTMADDLPAVLMLGSLVMGFFFGASAALVCNFTALAYVLYKARPTVEVVGAIEEL